jgi:hypothetical protein
MNKAKRDAIFAKYDRMIGKLVAEHEKLLKAKIAALQLERKAELEADRTKPTKPRPPRMEKEAK